MKVKFMLGSLLAIAVTAFGTSAVLAAETDSTVAYGYLSGQQQNYTRHAQFEKSVTLYTDAEREAFYSEAGIGGGQYSEPQLNTEALVEAGVIDQLTADRINAYASTKQVQIHNRYSNNLSSMTPNERHIFYAGYASDNSSNDPVGSLLAAGIITQAQADAINDYLK